MIEIPEMLTLIEIAVSERGENFRYADYLQTDHAASLDSAQDCRYRDINTGQPLCIAGYVLNEAGLLSLVEEGSTVEIQPRLVGKISYDAIEVLGKAQVEQDCGQSWGYALEEARLYAQELQS